MAMSAASAMMTAALAFAMMIATFALTMMSAATAAAAAACETLHQVLYLFLCGFTVLHDLTDEVEYLACQRVVGVNGHPVVLDLDDLSHELVVLIIRECDDRALVDILAVETAVDHKDLALQFVDPLRFIGTESLVWLEAEVERGTFLQIYQFLLELVECDAESCDKLKRVLCAGLFLQVFLAIVGDRIQLIYY